MIYVERGGNIVSAYIKEGFRRMYSASIDSDGQHVDFDEMLDKSPVDYKGRKLIPFNDIFCFWYIQKEIRDTILNEPYCYIGYKTKHKLKDYLKNRVSIGLTLGPSPNSSIESFLKKNPHLVSLFTEEEIARGKRY